MHLACVVVMCMQKIKTSRAAHIRRKEWDSLLHPYFSFDSDDAYEPALLKVLTLFSSIAAVRCAVPTSIGHNTFIIMTHASSPTCAAAPKCHCPSICPSISSINSKSSPVFFCLFVRPSVRPSAFLLYMHPSSARRSFFFFRCVSPWLASRLRTSSSPASTSPPGR